MEAVAGARTLTLPGRLSHRAEPLAALARECYPDMAVLVEEGPEGWLIRLAPVGELTRASDPGIAAVLAASHVDGRDLMGWHRFGIVGRALWLEAMYHSWALVAWSQWLPSAGDVRPLILHVARNDDLVAPALLCADGPASFVAIMEDLTVELADPATVRTAVERGLIGVGSYIVPLLRALPGDVVHLTPATAADVGPAARRRFAVEAGPLPSHPRLVVRDLADGPCSYRQTSDPAALADDWDHTQPVLLDIDLGYFDLVPKRRREPFGAPCSVSELIAGIRPMAAAIVAVTVAYSPGSCPSARWAALVHELRATLAPLLGA
jgi:hypothetical protein